MIALYVALACSQAPMDTGELYLTAPMLQIEPIRPKTNEDINAIVNKQSKATDVGEIETKYRWSSGDKVWTSSLLPHNLTRSGEIWTVEAWYESAVVSSAIVTTTVEIIDSPTQMDISIQPLFPDAKDDITAVVSIVDLDYHSVDVEYQWTKEGSPINWKESVLPSSFTSKGENWQVTALSNNGTQVAFGEAYSFTIGNTPPDLDGLTIFPLQPSRDDFLQLNIIANDFDGDDIQYEYRWYMNEALLIGQDGPRIYTGQFDQGDSISAEVRVTDGNSYSSWKFAYPVTILNSLPEITGLSITPSNPTSEQILTCSYEVFADADSDQDMTEIEWVRDGDILGYGAYLDLRPIVMQGYDRISCIARAYDGVDQGNVLTATIEVENTAPVTYDVALSPGTAYEASTLQCTPVNTVDIDGTTVFSYEYSWFVNGTEVSLTTSSATLTGLYFSRGDSVVCGVEAFDGISYGVIAYSNAVSISNSIPTATGIDITPSNPQFTSTLLCSIQNFSDGDNDSNQSLFLWKKNGQFLQYGQTVNLTQAQAGRIDVFTCEVTLFDGYDYGAQFSMDSSIGNVLPEIASIELNPTEPTSVDTVEATIAYSDADGDLVSIIYNWYVNGVLVGETGDSLAGYFSPGDDIELRATPYDGYEYGVEEISDVVTVVNTPPSEPTVEILETAQGLECTETVPSTDIDNHSISMTLQWWCDGQLLPVPTGPSDPALMNGFLTTQYTYDTVPTSLMYDCVLWICGMTPNDGFEDGQEGTSPVYIATP